MDVHNKIKNIVDQQSDDQSSLIERAENSVQSGEYQDDYQRNLFKGGSEKTGGKTGSRSKSKSRKSLKTQKSRSTSRSKSKTKTKRGTSVSNTNSNQSHGDIDYYKMEKMYQETKKNMGVNVLNYDGLFDQDQSLSQSRRSSVSSKGSASALSLSSLDENASVSSLSSLSSYSSKKKTGKGKGKGKGVGKKNAKKS